MTLKRVTLRLARNPDAGFPDGDPHQGYTIVAPLDREGFLDVGAWGRERKQCRVVRFGRGAGDPADGWLTHRGSDWCLHFDEVEEGPDESVYRLGEHRLVTNEYIAIHDRGGANLVYRVASVSDL